MSLDYLVWPTDDPNDYRAKIDESINLFRQAPISSTVAAGTDGEDYEVDDWAPLTITDGLVYPWRAHIDNLGAFSIKHGATTYDVLLPDGANPVRKQVHKGHLYFVQRDGSDFILLNPETIYSESNRIINPEFTVGQRGPQTIDSTTTPVNNDDTYFTDRWYLLSDGNDIVDIFTFRDGFDSFSSGFLNAGYVYFDVETANKKFGLAQIVEKRNCVGLVESVCSLSFLACMVAGDTSLTKIRAAVVEWQGAADTVTSDIVSAWNAEDTNPTLIANAVYANTPVALDVVPAGGFKQYTIENIPISAAATNLIVFIWVENTTTIITDRIVFSQIKLQPGPVCTPFEASRRLFADELRLCERYYQKSYNLDVVPGTATTVGAVAGRLPAGAQTTRILQSSFSTRMRATPTVKWYSTNDGTIDRVYNSTDAANRTVSSTTSAGERTTGWPTLSTTETDGDGLEAHWTADAEL